MTAIVVVCSDWLGSVVFEYLSFNGASREAVSGWLSGEPQSHFGMVGVGDMPKCQQDIDVQQVLHSTSAKARCRTVREIGFWPGLSGLTNKPVSGSRTNPLNVRAGVGRFTTADFFTTVFLDLVSVGIRQTLLDSCREASVGWILALKIQTALGDRRPPSSSTPDTGVATRGLQ